MNSGKQTKRVIAVAGGGAAGMMAAAAAAQNGSHVLLFDRNDILGRKIHATGNGRCNLTNEYMSDTCYNVPVLKRIAAFDSHALMDDFQRHGVFLHSRNGYVYPRTDQAATVAASLLQTLRSTGRVEQHCGEPVTQILDERAADGQKGFVVHTDKGDYHADRVILATGGLVSTAVGCSGDGYRFAKQFGHHVTATSPGLVPVYVNSPYLKTASGVRCNAGVTAYIDGNPVATDIGELQMTDRGLSGIPIFQVSRWVSQALGKGLPVEIHVNYVPDIPDADYAAEIMRRQSDPGIIYVRDVFAGLIHERLGSYFARKTQLADEKKLARLENRREVIRRLLEGLREETFRVTGTADYDKAQVTAGGVPLEEIDMGFMSRRRTGLYLCGELLDVDGICGGYNLTFAMCSGHIAGVHAAMDEN